MFKILFSGKTAARALLGPGFAMKTRRGTLHKKIPPVLTTHHPAAILRAQGDERDALKQTMFDNIQKAVRSMS